MREIKLLKKPVSKWTRKEAIIESIKLWAFLAADGSRSKTDYFGQEDVILSDCFLCAYYFENRYLKWCRKSGRAKLSSPAVCKKFKCCLYDISLCGFNDEYSAYNMWLNSYYGTYEYEIRGAAAAQTILDALKAEYKNITGEEYHE